VSITSLDLGVVFVEIGVEEDDDETSCVDKRSVSRIGRTLLVPVVTSTFFFKALFATTGLTPALVEVALPETECGEVARVVEDLSELEE